MYINQLEEEGIEVGLYTIIVECEGKRRVLKMADMYVFSNDGSELVYFNAESVLTSAIVNVASQRDTGVGVVLGHGEEISTSFQELCVLNNFELGGIVLNKDVGEDIDILLVMAPQTDFSEAELVVLDKFFARGGAMAVFSDPSVPDLPNLDSFLLEWGIEFEDNVIFDSASNIESNPINVIPYYVEDHEITEYFMTKQYYTVYGTGCEIDCR